MLNPTANQGTNMGIRNISKSVSSAMECYKVSIYCSIITLCSNFNHVGGGMRGRIVNMVPSFLKKKKSSEDNEAQELADMLVPFKEQMVEFLKSNRAYGIQRRATVLQAQFAKNPNDRNESAQALLQTIPKALLKGANIRFLGDNNCNMAVQTKTAAVVIQATSLDKNQMNSINKLYESGLAGFLPVNYAQPSIMLNTNPQKSSYKKHAELNPDTTVDDFKNSYIISCIEHFPMSFADKVDSMHHGNSEHVYEETANIAGQLSNIFTTLNKQGLVWTDLKPGNILSREDGSLAVADLKGFYDIHSIFMRRNDDAISCQWNFTTGFMSKSAMDRIAEYPMDSKKDLSPTELSQNARDYFFQEWQKENCYQIGILLYSSITGFSKDEQLISEETGKVIFDFDLPVFKTAQGQEFAKIIQKLTHENPDKRLHYADAAENLQRISRQYTARATESPGSTSSMIAKMGGSADRVAKKPMELSSSEEFEAEAPKKSGQKVLSDTKTADAPSGGETRKLTKKSLQQVNKDTEPVVVNPHTPK